MASISLRNLHKNYQNTPTLHDLSLDIADGEFVALVGPSGCGKSTLLRMVAGLEDISGGSIWLGERRINEVAPQQRNLAMVFQNYALYPHMSVRENLGFALKMQRRPKDEIAQRVQEVANMIGLEALLERRPAQLSGGQRQRVAMGRAIVRKPQAFLFDEPLSNLDAKLRVHMRSEIKALHQRLGTTTLYVTHDQIEAMTMADRIVVMRDGRIEQSGSPLALYDQPANAFVAQFIGSPAMNLISARVVDNQWLTEDGVPLPLPVPSQLQAGQAVLIGIRAEDLRIVEREAIAPALHAEVLVVEPTGADTHITAQLGAQRLICVTRQRVKLAPSSPIQLHIPPHKAHFFDAAQGQRL